MFANFIYIIIVLLIYSSYFPPENLKISLFEPLFSFFCLLCFFVSLTWMQFRKLESRIVDRGSVNFDQKLSATITRQSILAVLIFAINVYILNLPLITGTIPFLASFPTLQAGVFIGLFVFYLTIIWFFAFRSHQLITRSELSRRSYISSNILFSVPVLIPWFLLSFIVDVVNLLPFEMPKRLLSTTEGQIVYFLVFLFVISIIGPVMIRMVWRCKPLDKGFHRQQIENLCKRAGVKYADILLWPIFEGRMITAGVLGLVKKFRYILVTTGLLQSLEPHEIEAVIAHEIGHVKHNHLFFYLFFFTGYMILSYTAIHLIIYALYSVQPVYLLLENAGLSRAAITSTIFSTAIILMFFIYFRYIFGYFMRNFERQADIFVFELFHTSKSLISTFEKIVTSSGQASDSPNWHHFSIKERMDYLKKCEADRLWIEKHHRKVKKSIFAFLIAMVIIGAVSYAFNFGETGKQFNAYLIKTILLREIDKNPNQSDRYNELGDFYYTQENFPETVKAYERSLGIEPGNVHALNNLAWLYATCEDKRFFIPEKALALAKRAAEIKDEPHILDTLAESYYVNGLYDQAVAAERQAIGLIESAPENPDSIKTRDYYDEQLRKFSEAANR